MSKSPEELQAELDAALAELAKLKAKPTGPVCEVCQEAVRIPPPASRMPIPKLCPPCRKERTQQRIREGIARAQKAMGGDNFEE